MIIIRRLILLILLCLAQALVFNRFQLLHCATPLIYIYFVILFPKNEVRGFVLLWSFLLGVIVDSFSNTPGVATMSLTATAFLQPYLLMLFLPRDADPDMDVSARSLGWGKFTAFSSIIIVVFCLLFFMLESFSFFQWLDWILATVGSSIITLLLILIIESFRK